MTMMRVNGNTGDAMLLPPPEDTCQECAWKHTPEQPHNQQTMFWQYKFRQKRGRWPTWKDAVAHCTPAVQAHWEAALRKIGEWSEPITSKEDEVLATIEGSPIIKELPPGAPIPPLMKVTTHKLRERRKKRSKGA